MIITILPCNCLFLDKEIQGKFLWILKVTKDFLKRNFKKRIVYIVRIKTRLNLIR